MNTRPLPSRPHRQKGWVLFTVIAALVIVALGLGYAFTLFAGSQEKQDTQALTQATAQLRGNIQSAFSREPDYCQLTQTVAIKTGLYPKQFPVVGASPRNSYGGVVRTGPSGPGGCRRFYVEHTGLNGHACRAFAATGAQQWDSILISGVDILAASKPFDAALTACAKTGNTVRLIAR